MNKKMLLFLFLALFFKTEALQAISQETMKPKVMVYIDNGKPEYLHGREHFECSGGSVNHDTRGCSRVELYAAIKPVSFGLDGSLTELELHLGVQNIEIELSSLLETGSCLYEATLKHELTHLALHRAVVARFAPEIAKALLARLQTFSPPLTQAKVNQLSQLLKKYATMMKVEDERQNALMDTQSAYLHLDQQCK